MEPADNSDSWDTYDWDQPFDLETVPFDQPTGFDWIDWGGDGSTPERPVRAHVLAALVPVDQPYPASVAALCHLGHPDQEDVHMRRRQLGLMQEHVPDLVRMARDRALNTAYSNTDQVWAPIHALHALANLNISTVVSDLIPLFDLQGDWTELVLTDILGQAGAVAIEPLATYLNDRTHWIYGRADAISALQKVAENFSECRSHVVQIMQNALADADNEHEVVNGFLIDALVDLDAVEALPQIRHAFEQNRVDEWIRGDWGKVLADLGIEADPEDPLIQQSAQRWEEQRSVLVERLRLNLPLFEPGVFDELEYDEEDEDVWDWQPAPAPVPLPPALPAPPLPDPAAPAKTHAQVERKAKQKRKQSSASRKANQRKKKRK